ncbi:flagellar motor protein MotB [Halomonadaceae bacterium KBTZ08]
MEDRPIVVKRVKKVEGGHHGGAWKVAFADFAMALMAFFLVMWATNQATPEQKEDISKYFSDPVGYEEGGNPNPVDLGGAPAVTRSSGPSDVAPEPLSLEEDQVEELAEAMERRQTEQLMQELDEKLKESETLQKFKDQLMIDITDEGLRIQIVDRSQRPMFASGGDELKPYSRDILFELAEPLAKVSKKLSITGHTDRTPFARSNDQYTNWELSADRANAARRTLVAGGVPEDHIGRVVGLADSVLFNKENPKAPVNRRISIIVLTEAARKAMEKRESGNTADAEDRETMADDNWMERAREDQVDESEVNW